ncbi:MAG: S24/S26 family peptidase [Chitinispirillaceae bacterium]|nr:S24/S26 family peptidase [Chitinispirillaceae bacterium]
MGPEEKAALLGALSVIGSCVVTVGGKSMWPFIRSGDRVKIVPRSGEPEPGSVAALFCEDRLLVHRIVQCSSQGFLLAGDSSPGSFSRVAVNDIAGIVVSCERAGRWRSAWLHPPLSRFAVMLGYLLRFLVSAKERLPIHTK